MANKPVEALIKCPFYVSETRNFLCCEGFLKNTCMTTRFPDANSKKAHLKANCFEESGGSCPMAKTLFEKYGMNSLRD